VLEQALLDALGEVVDLTAEFSDQLNREGYLLSVPVGRLKPTLAGARLIGPAATVRYLPERQQPAALRNVEPDGKLGNKRLASEVTHGSVMVVQSPRTDVSVLGSEAAESLQSAGVLGAIVDGAVRDLEGLTRLDFACWTSGRTPISGRWHLEAAAFGEPVAICGVQVRQGDVVVADDGGVVFVPAGRFEELARQVLGRG
jgi:4-hydroxy-4-methyl-2-oxoglutarate aldolase